MTVIKSRLRIESDSYLVVQGGNELGLKRQRDFRLDLNDVRVVGISGSLSFDDEELYINLVVKSGENYSINSYLVNDEFAKYLEEKYLFDRSYFSRDWEFHEKKISEIIHPLELKGKPLFEKSNSSILSMFKWMMRKTKMIDYNDFLLARDVEYYLKK